MNTDTMNWGVACTVGDIEPEDVRRFDHAGRTYAIYRSPGGEFYPTGGLCTHAGVHLAGGMVIDGVIECPKHNGRFDYRSGRAQGVPVCVDRATHPVRLDGESVLIGLAWSEDRPPSPRS